MQYSLASQLHYVSLKMSSQSMGNILLNLGKMGMHYEDFSDNLKISIEVGIRKLLNGKMCKDYDLMQLVYGIHLINFKWHNLSQKTKEALSTAIFLRSKQWSRQGQSSIIEYSIMLTYLHRLGVNWDDSLPTLKSGVLIGLASVTDSNSTEYLKWNRDDYIRMRKLKHGIIKSTFLSHQNASEKRSENVYVENGIVPYTMKDTENSFINSIPLVWHSLAGFNISLNKDFSNATTTSSIPPSILYRFYDLTIVFMSDYSFRGYSMIANSLSKMITLELAPKPKQLSKIPKLFQSSFSRYFFLHLNRVASYSHGSLIPAADLNSDNDVPTIKSVASVLRKMNDIGFQLNRDDAGHRHNQKQLMERFVLTQTQQSLTPHSDGSLDIFSSTLYALSSVGMKWCDLSDGLKSIISQNLVTLQQQQHSIGEWRCGINNRTATASDISNIDIAQILKTVATLEPKTDENFDIHTSLEEIITTRFTMIHNGMRSTTKEEEEVLGVSLVLFYTGKLLAKNILPLSFLEKEVSMKSHTSSGHTYFIRYLLYDIMLRYIPKMDSHMISNLLNSLQNMNCSVHTLPKELLTAVLHRVNHLLVDVCGAYEAPQSVVSSLSALTNMGFNATHLNPLQLHFTKKITLCSTSMNSLESRIILKIINKLEWTLHVPKTVVAVLFNNILSELVVSRNAPHLQSSPSSYDSFTAIALLRLMALYNITSDAINPVYKEHLIQFVVKSVTREQTSYNEYFYVLNEMYLFNITWSQLTHLSRNYQDITNKAMTFITHNDYKYSDFKISYELLGKFTKLGMVLNAHNTYFVNTIIEASCEYVLRFPQYNRKLDDLSAKNIVANTDIICATTIQTNSFQKLKNLISDLSTLGVDWDLLSESSRRSVIRVISLALIETLDYLKQDGEADPTAVDCKLNSAYVYDEAITLFKTSLNILLHFDQEWASFPTRPRNLLALAFAKVLQNDNACSVENNQTEIVIKNMQFVLRSTLLNKLSPSPSLVPKELRTLLFSNTDHS